MKRTFWLLLAVCFFVLCACEKMVVEEYPSEEIVDPNASGESSPTEENPTGGLTKDDPLSVADFKRSAYGDTAVWVVGYIVGDCKMHINNAEWAPPFSYDTAILLADESGETDSEKVISIQLTTSAMKKELGLLYHPEIKGQRLLVCGVKQTYLGVVGIKGRVEEYVLLSQ